MLIYFIIAFIIAKIKGYKISYLFKSWTIYPVLAIEIIYIFSQVNFFLGNYDYIHYAPFIKKFFLYSLLIPLIFHKLYTPGLIGSCFIFIGTFLNFLVIQLNGGKMPVFPSLSYITGYLKPELFNSPNSIHVLGSCETRLKFLADYIDIGYSIMSIGDVLVDMFGLIIIYFTIKTLNQNKAKEV